MRKLIRFIWQIITVSITSLCLLGFIGSKIQESPGAVILLAAVFIAWMVCLVISMVRLLGVRRD